MAIGLLRIDIRMYRLELRKRLLGILSDIYYRFYYYNELTSCNVSITGKITGQVDAKRDARSFWWGWCGLVSSKLTIGSQCIETQLHTSPISMNLPAGLTLQQSRQMRRLMLKTLPLNPKSRTNHRTRTPNPTALNRAKPEPELI